MTPKTADSGTLPPLVDGERLDQKTFHERYEAMPEGTRAELIGGVVHMPSPLRRLHSHPHLLLARLVTAYMDETPGTEANDNASSLLGVSSEPQPDLCLLIVPEAGGQTRVKDDFIVGAPELVIEVSVTTESLDLGEKKADYERYGVREYLVAAMQRRRVFWFVLQDEAFVERPADGDGVIRSTVFPGFWVDAAAILAGDVPRAKAVLRAGLATPEHAAFVAELARRRGASHDAEGC